MSNQAIKNLCNLVSEMTYEEMKMHPEWYDEPKSLQGLKLIPGVTKKRFKHNKISIVFGIKDEHYDPSF